jgi:hypothetical protein
MGWSNSWCETGYRSVWFHIRYSDKNKFIDFWGFQKDLKSAILLYESPTHSRVQLMNH